MTDDEREAYRRTLMKLYEKAWLDYGEKRFHWKFNRKLLLYVASNGGESYSALIKAAPDYAEVAKNTWKARCTAIKLREELFHGNLCAKQYYEAWKEQEPETQKKSLSLL